MFSFVQAQPYRDDIDGLRALAVLAVIAFHCGYLPNGFLGVDVFFTISGFLITGIIHRKVRDNSFSIIDFYLRRIRRIIPLALLTVAVALALGIITMLPDDLENLAQSVVATNFFSNNILQAITTKNYWDVVNEYKPLMHTWSLGVEEQFYLLYPYVLVLLGVKRDRFLLPMIAALAALSLALYLSASYDDSQKFYLVYFRFWELAVGGIMAIALENKLISHQFAIFPVAALILLLSIDFSFMTSQVTLLIVIALTSMILTTANSTHLSSSFLLKNKLLVQIGKISFSLYMWHQVVLAYSRYFWSQQLDTTQLLTVLALTLFLSILSYTYVETPFRDKKRISTRTLLPTLAIVMITTTTLSLWIYFQAGVIRNVPELGISKATATRHMHALYNERIRDYDVDFHSTGKIRTLVVGNSFARDWINVLLESAYANELEISYIENGMDYKTLRQRASTADVIFFSATTLHDVNKAEIDERKVWVIGTKNFGTNNGVFYNHRGPDYYQQRTEMESGYADANQRMKREWGSRYIDYIAKVVDKDNRVPVFSPSGQFISQDCRHFTKSGAEYFAELLNSDLAAIFNPAELHASHK